MMQSDLRLLVDGEWIGGSSRKTLEVYNPATGSAVAQLPVAEPSDVEAAAASSNKAFTEWRTQSPNVRAGLLLRAAQLLRERREQIARMLTIEQGKPLAESRAEVDTAAAYTEYYAGQAVRLPGYALAHPDDAKIGMSVVAQPIGPSLILVPWNFPVAEAAVHVAPAIAAGCTVILKPPEEAPAAAIAYARCFVDAGAPHGVINVLAGNPVLISESLIADPRIRRVAFTGSTVVGRRLSALAGQHLKQTVMELGGNAPFIVTADADMECAIAALVASKLRNAGQVCIAPNRIYVARPISSEFVGRLVSAFEAVKVGDGQENGVEMGPLVNERRVLGVEQQIHLARLAGGTVLTGGSRVRNSGNFFAPTVVTNVPDTCPLGRDEIFGPVAVVSEFDTLDEVIARANSTMAGLAAYAFCGSARDSTLLANRLLAGMVGINTTRVASFATPFGGLRESGWGRVGGPEGIQACLDMKLISQAQN